jgi:transposase-like protein
VTASESAELRELRKRNKLLEQENEILRRRDGIVLRATAEERPGPAPLDHQKGWIRA